MNDERSAQEGRKVLKELGVQCPDVLLMFRHDLSGLADGELELWHSELRRSYLPLADSKCCRSGAGRGWFTGVANS